MISDRDVDSFDDSSKLAAIALCNPIEHHLWPLARQLWLTSRVHRRSWFQDFKFWVQVTRVADHVAAFFLTARDVPKFDIQQNRSPSP
jgi:hypothetical protein